MAISDNFNRADNTNINTSAPFTWAAANGSLSIFNILSNQLRFTGDPSINDTIRAEVDLAAADHFAQVTLVTNDAGINAGVCCRFASASFTCYAYIYHANTAYTLYSISGGTFTQLGTGTLTRAANDVVKIQASGSSIKCFLNGTLDISVTDSSITTGVRTGILAGFSSSPMQLDDFSADTNAVSPFPAERGPLAKRVMRPLIIR